jgi:serine/threonine-protein kinase
LSLSPGQAFGNYRILSRIGVGGMGMVFLAEHPHIGKRVALKIIHRDLAGNREVVNRFLNEARAVNHIGSEHIVQIHDFGQTEEGEHFFIMEFLDGRTLAQELSACGVLEVPRALHIGAQIAAALAAAHDVDIIHRDLKPDNVMLIHRLGDPDFVKLLDFGLAKFLTDADARKLTAAGVVLGTPHYMSPEACESKPNVDHRCDVYSLGVLLFQMLTGKLPFTGESMGEILVKQVVQPPPAPRGLNPHIPPAVEQVVLRCLAKDPAARFQSARELRDVLLDPAGYLASSPPVMPVASSHAAETMYGRPSSRTAARAAAPTRLAMAAERPTEMAVDTPWREARHEPTPPGDAPTAYMDAAAHRKYAGADASPPSAPRPAPRPVENRTMAIAPPDGYSEHPPRRLWPLVVAILIAGAVAGVAAFLVVRPDAPAGAVPVQVPVARRAVQPEPAADAGPRQARIHLTTRPPGAEVSDQDGKALGVTPTGITLPIDGREVVLRFRHPEAIDSEKRFVPTRDVAFDIDLPPVPTAEKLADGADDEGAGEGESGSTPSAREAPRRSEKRRPRRRKKPPGDDLLIPQL